MSQLFTTTFSRTSTASEVIDGVGLSGKRAIVTGAGSGIGTETARALASAGAEVVLAVRRPQAAGQIAAGIASSTGNTKVSVRALDLADQDSVRRFAAAWDQPLHILVNNAGIMALPELERTAERWEMQFATNYLGHFALTTGLHDALAAAHGARIVSVSSSGHLFSPVVFDDLHFDFRAYDPFAAYGQSKTADALLAIEATRRWSGEGIYANALNPGAIAHRPATAHRRPEDPERAAEDRPAGRRHLRVAGRFPDAGQGRRPLFRGLQRGTRRHPPPRRLRRRRLVRPRPGQRRAAVGRRT